MFSGLELRAMLESPTLRAYAESILPAAFAAARKTAALEIHVLNDWELPGACPWTLDEALRDPDDRD